MVWNGVRVRNGMMIGPGDIGAGGYRGRGREPGIRAPSSITWKFSARFGYLKVLKSDFKIFTMNEIDTSQQ